MRPLPFLTARRIGGGHSLPTPTAHGNRGRRTRHLFAMADGTPSGTKPLVCLPLFSPGSRPCNIICIDVVIPVSDQPPPAPLRSAIEPRKITCLSHAERNNWPLLRKLRNCRAPIGTPRTLTKDSRQQLSGGRRSGGSLRAATSPGTSLGDNFGTRSETADPHSCGRRETRSLARRRLRDRVYFLPFSPHR
jgi:hypothetical protein